MILPCETAVRSVIPALRALIAKELMEQEGLSQEETAEILGISQSAVSKYSRKVRGNAVKVDDVNEVNVFVHRIVVLLMDGERQNAEVLGLFCQACIAIRRTNLMCEFCQKSDPKIKIEDCKFCISRV